MPWKEAVFAWKTRQKKYFLNISFMFLELYAIKYFPKDIISISWYSLLKYYVFFKASQNFRQRNTRGHLSPFIYSSWYQEESAPLLSPLEEINQQKGIFQHSPFLPNRTKLRIICKTTRGHELGRRENWKKCVLCLGNGICVLLNNWWSPLFKLKC